MNFHVLILNQHNDDIHHISHRRSCEDVSPNFLEKMERIEFPDKFLRIKIF